MTEAIGRGNLYDMTTSIRVALVLFGVLLFGGIAATIVPTHPHDAVCGSWVFPEWDRATVEQMLRQGDRLQSKAIRRGEYDNAREAASIATGSFAAYEACDSALSTRRTLSIALLIGAVVVPGAVVFIGRSRTA